jgi:plasmid maintenance system antidote protein VapI
MTNTIDHSQALELIKQLVKQKGSQLKAARHLDISPQYIGDIIAGKREISQNVAAALGYRRVVGFVPIKKEKAQP